MSLVDQVKVAELVDCENIPSKDELIEIYYTIGPGGDYGNIGNFEINNSTAYWSSSESDLERFWGVYFNNGHISQIDKPYPHRVRPIRSF